MLLHAYFNVSLIFKKNPATSHVESPPDATGRIEYSADSSFPGDRLWDTSLQLHPYQGQHQPRIVACSNSDIFEEYPYDHHIPVRYAAHWLHPHEIIHYLNNPNVPLTMRRSHCSIEWENLVGPEHESLSSSAYRVLWVDAETGNLPGELSPIQLHFYTLVPPSDDEAQHSGGSDRQVAIKGVFGVPVDVQDATWIGFFDAAAVLTLAIRGDDGDQIHFFEY